MKYMKRFIIALAVLVPAHVFAASLYFAPASKTVAIGDDFTVAVDVSSADQAMNAASGDISFPSGKLRVLSVSNAASAMNLWVQNPTFSNAASGGDINFAGVVLNPGFTGTAGNVVTIRFQALATGSASLSFTAGSILANDGNGTDILSSMGTGNITITPASAPVSVPAPSPSPAPVVASAPAPFVVSEETNDLTDPQPIFTWATNAPSGIAKYLIKIGVGSWFDASTLEISSAPDAYQLPLQAPGENILLAVDAYDNGGDVTEATTTFTIAALPAPLITDYPKQIASGQLLKVAGTMSEGVTATNGAESTTVTLYLEQAGKVLTFPVLVDAKGNWSVAENVTAANGAWTLKAQATDARGAVSDFTPDYTIAINGWLDEAISFLLTWGIVILLALLLLSAIITLAYYSIHHLRRFRLSLSRDLIRERKELRDDLRRIEKELEADRPNAKIDLSASGMHKKQQLVHKEIEHLEDDLKRDIKENE